MDIQVFWRDWSIFVDLTQLDSAAKFRSFGWLSTWGFECGQHHDWRAGPGGWRRRSEILFSCSPWNPGRLTRIGWLDYKRDDEILPNVGILFVNHHDWWWQLKYFFFPSQFWGKWIQFDQYVSNGLKSPNRYICSTNWSSCCLTNMRMYPI